MTQQLVFLLRMVLACLCGAAVGTERTVRLKEAGIRTHTVVALGAALMVEVSKYGFTDAAAWGGSFDASRVAASVVAGISFLGAGVIFVRGSAIRGLTTSAGIWTTAGIGMAFGAGMYAVGAMATVLLIVLQLVLHRFVGGLDGVTLTPLSVTVPYSPGVISRVKELLRGQGLEIHGCRVVKGSGEDMVLYLTAGSREALQPEALAALFQEDPEIREYSMG